MKDNALDRKIIVLVAISWGLKLLLFPSYYSTDFAVHQNWLRITHNLPLSEWYTDSLSKWTLDYPPLFAYFQYILSKIAYLIDPSIVAELNQLPNTVAFQRFSVMATDIFFLFSLLQTTNYKINARVLLAYFWLPFILLDNIHFQYNTLLQGILIYSVSAMMRKRYLKAAFYFSTLLNFKHIYLYCAPAFFIYLLKEYVFGDRKVQDEETNNFHQINQMNQMTQTNMNLNRHHYVQQQQLKIWKLFKLGIVTLAPFLLSFGPFFIVGGTKSVSQIFSRLFPFSRGLVHDYWAPNFWAIYSMFDKILYSVGIGKRQMFQIGLSQTNLRFLPDISPSTTIIIILLLLFPIIMFYFSSKKKVNFANLVSVCGLIFFLFGFHVHQKAISPYINILFVFAPHTPFINSSVFVNLINLLPLLIRVQQKPFCIAISLLWIAIWDSLEHKKRQRVTEAQQLLIRNLSLNNAIHTASLFIQNLLQLLGMFIVVFHLLIHPFLNGMQFLPLMMNSVWAAFFNICWTGYLYFNLIKQTKN